MRAWKEEVAPLLEVDEGLGLQTVSVTIEIAWPDRRRRDIDGPVKPVLDALVDADWFEDDSLVQLLIVRTAQAWIDEPVEPGFVRVESMPWPPF
jgi:Holliday junction resolvase RusA-like endonuclease